MVINLYFIKLFLYFTLKTCFIYIIFIFFPLNVGSSYFVHTYICDRNSLVATKNLMCDYIRIYLYITSTSLMNGLNLVALNLVDIILYALLIYSVS